MRPSFEEIVKRSTKTMKPPKDQSVSAPTANPLSRRERQVIQYFRSIPDDQKRTVLAMLKMLSGIR